MFSAKLGGKNLQNNVPPINWPDSKIAFPGPTQDLRLQRNEFQRVPSRKEEITKNVHKLLKANCGLTCPLGRFWKAQKK